MKSNLSDDKTKAIIHCDLLSASWLNLKNSEEKLVSILKSINSKSLKGVLQTFFKDFSEFNNIQDDTNFILREMDKEMQKINDTLKTYNSPVSIISSEFIKPKFDWFHANFVNEIDKLKQINGDLEDRLTSLQNENHQIHAEFKAYVDRIQLEKGYDPQIEDELNFLKQKCQNLEQRFTDSDNECLFLRCTIEELNQQISKLNSEINGEKQNLQIKQLNEQISLLNIKIDAKNEQLKILQEIIETSKINKDDCQDEINKQNQEFIEMKSKVDAQDLQIKSLQNMLDEINFRNHEIQHELNIEKQKHTESSIKMNRCLVKNVQCDANGILPSIISENCFNERNSKDLTQVQKLTHELVKLSDRYTEKRERHRHKLLEARVIYNEKIHQLMDNESEYKTVINDISAKLGNTELHLKNVTQEKLLLLTKISKLENKCIYSSNEIRLHQDKIFQLENQMKWIKSEFLENNTLVLN